jgi:hypothetical protein
MGYSINILVPVALFGFVPLGVLLFAFMPARLAVAWVFVLGWMFLPPNVGYGVPILPDWAKPIAISFTALLGALIFDSARLFRFRPAWYDLPVVAWMIWPFFVSMVNGLGVTDGVSAIYGNCTWWGIAYFLGRVYFADPAGIRVLAWSIVVGTILYTPFVLYELVMSPQLNRMLYGYHQTGFGMTRRGSSWRPMVFMQHGLMLTLWMCSGALIAMVFWMSGSVKTVLRIPSSLWAIVLTLVAAACQSFGALALMLAAMAIAIASKQLRFRLLLGVALAIPTTYMVMRMTGLWDGNSLIEASRAVGGDDRAGSLMIRIRNETAFINRAMQQPIFGWGGFGRSRPTDAEAGFRVLSDGYWIIILGQHGLVGLSLLTWYFTAPVAMFLSRWRSAAVTHPWLAPAFALSLVLMMFMTDCLFNAMPNVVFGLVAGGLAGLVPTPALLQAMFPSRSAVPSPQHGPPHSPAPPQPA